MKKLLVDLVKTTVMIATVLALTSCTSPEEGPLNVMSLNIRLDVASDAPNDWKSRRPVIRETILGGDYDLLGFQEVLHNQLLDLDSMLTGYDHIGAGREDGDTKGEACAIFFKSDRFELIGKGTFWLSPDPSDTGSVGWDAALPRIVTWVMLKDKLSPGRPGFYFLNTHFDHVGDTARQESAGTIVNFIREKTSGFPVIVTGDFNCGPASAPYSVITAEGRLTDACTATGGTEEASFNGFGKSQENERIDFIFTNDLLQPQSYQMLKIVRNGLYISDHYPVVATLKMKD